MQELPFDPQEPLDLQALTAGQPFCAAVYLAWEGRLVATLHSRWGPPVARRPGLYHVGGTGGGQEPGEDPAACARREGEEEAGAPVRLLPSPVSYWTEGIDRHWLPVRCSDTVPPAIIARTWTGATRPYKAGLPVGPWLYSANYLGQLEAPPHPGRSEVEAILLLPLSEVRRLVAGGEYPVAELEAGGARLLCHLPLAPGAILAHFPQEESLPLLLRLLDWGLEPRLLGLDPSL